MMPDLVSIGPLTVHWYGVMMALGFLAGLLNWVLLGRPIGRDFKFCSDLLFWIMVAGIVGARIAYVISDLPYFLANPLRIVRIDEGGLVYFGGFLGAWLALYLFARRHRMPFFELADLVVTSLPLAHAFGRVGCFLNGCCHGTITRCPLGVTYPARSMVWRHQLMADQLGAEAGCSMPVHPVQLYEAGFNLLLFGLLLLVWRTRRRAGMVGVVYVLVYSVGRFAIEFLRGDHRIRWVGMSIAQWVSIALFLAGLGLWYGLRRSAQRQQESA
jgi:phosphatidylglycerol:prolipoprotein diacylglycerol transferase